MPRRNRPKNSKKDDSEEFNVDRLLGIQRSENWSDGDWVVRRVTGSAVVIKKLDQQHHILLLTSWVN
jgi:SOS-response transcriptional repressor LexA